MKYPSKIIREFEKFPYKNYDRRRPNHEPTDCYLYLTRHIVKCMMRSGALNLHLYPVRTKNDWCEIDSEIAHLFYE